MKKLVGGIHSKLRFAQVGKCRRSKTRETEICQLRAHCLSEWLINSSSNVKKNFKIYEDRFRKNFYIVERKIGILLHSMKNEKWKMGKSNVYNAIRYSKKIFHLIFNKFKSSRRREKKFINIKNRNNKKSWKEIIIKEKENWAQLSFFERCLTIPLILLEENIIIIYSIYSSLSTDGDRLIFKLNYLGRVTCSNAENQIRVFGTTFVGLSRKKEETKWKINVNIME